MKLKLKYFCLLFFCSLFSFTICKNMNQGSKYMDIFRMDMSTKKLIKFAHTQVLLVNPIIGGVENTYILKIPVNMLKLGNFQKSLFFGGSEGIVWFLTPQKDFTYQYLFFLRSWRPKNAVFQKFWILKNMIWCFE